MDFECFYYKISIAIKYHVYRNIPICDWIVCRYFLILFSTLLINSIVFLFSDGTEKSTPIARDTGSLMEYLF